MCLSTTQKTCAVRALLPLISCLPEPGEDRKCQNGRQVALIWALLGDMNSSMASIQRGHGKSPQLMGYLRIISKMWSNAFAPSPLQGLR